MKAISVQNLSFAYGERVVLHNIQVDIEADKLTLIMGRNGSGKSTFLRILAGLLPFKVGHIDIMGHDLVESSLSQRAKVIGFLAQHHKPVFPFSVLDVVLTGRASYIRFIPNKEDYKKAMEALDRIGILDLKERLYTELSGGEQQMVLIARVLAQNPKVILFDEPTTHLDFYNQTRLLQLLKNLVKEKITIVAVLHDPNIAFLFGDDFLFIKGHRLIRTGDTIEPWDIEFLKSVYQCEMVAIPYGNRALIVPPVKK